MCSKNNISFEEFWLFAREWRAEISRNNAEVFWHNYYSWDEFYVFLEVMKARTNLSFADILDLESAYQTLLGNRGLLEIEDFVEALEWNKILKICLNEIGEEKFVPSYHCHPNYIYGEIMRRDILERRIRKRCELFSGETLF